MIGTDIDRVFPATFEYKKESGSRTSRRLFGPAIEVISKLPESERTESVNKKRSLKKQAILDYQSSGHGPTMVGRCSSDGGYALLTMSQEAKRLSKQELELQEVDEAPA